LTFMLIISNQRKACRNYHIGGFEVYNWRLQSSLRIAHRIKALEADADIALFRRNMIAFLVQCNGCLLLTSRLSADSLPICFMLVQLLVILTSLLL
jgi:hypothetical protein